MIGFGKFSKKADTKIITSLTDNRLVKIDPQEPGFFDEVLLNFKSTNKSINDFIEAVAEVKEARIEAFYKPIYDPSDAGDHRVTYMKGMRPATGQVTIGGLKQPLICLQLKVGTGVWLQNISIMPF